MIRDNRVHGLRAYMCAWSNSVYSAVAVLLPLGLLAACSGDSSSPIADADLSADQILESSRPDTAVGLTLTVPKFAGSPMTFSLIDNSGGAFNRFGDRNGLARNGGGLRGDQ